MINNHLFLIYIENYFSNFSFVREIMTLDWFGRYYAQRLNCNVYVSSYANS